MRRALVIVGKAPRAGSTKTRLVPPLSADEAADLYRALLVDTVEVGLSLDWERVTLVHPSGADQTFALEQLLPSEVQLAAQAGRGLGDALSAAFTTHFLSGFARVVLVASDSPALPRNILESALSALDDHDLVVGPTLDGGYYLIGLQHQCGAVFEGIEWSTSRVFEQTLAQAQQHRLRVQTLPEWFDIDEAADLPRARALLSTCTVDVARHTRQALARLALDRVSDVVS